MMLAPKPYAKTTRNGKTIDQLTNYALYAMEGRLGYAPGSLTVVQGSYNRGGVSASAGTHDGGGAVDLTPEKWQAKVHAARAVGFAAWHRPAIAGLWAEHVHMVLIGNAKLSPAAANQVVDYRDHLDGLADNAPDPTWHPDPIPTFKMPVFAEGSVKIRRAPKRRVFHVHKGDFYYTEDSFRGLKFAIAKLFGWVDFDLHKTKDGVLIVAHGPRPLAKNTRGGFHDTGKNLDPILPGDTYEDLTWAQVQRLRSNDGKGYRVSRAAALIPAAIRKGVAVEADAKTTTITEADWADLRSKVSDPSKLQAKGFPEFAPSLKTAHQAGVTTIALTHPGHEVLPADAETYIDYFRGKEPRLAPTRRHP